jgi:hypothetical protein
MQTADGHGPIPGLSPILRFAANAVRDQRALRRAIKRMPTPVPWDWASSRLIPLLAGPRFDEPGLSIIRVRSEIGPVVEFGLDLGGVFAIVDQGVADRWECTGDQLLDRGLANLHEWASRIEPHQVVTGVMSGRSIRLLMDRPAWASSILLDRDARSRLFGEHDQILAAPTTSTVVSLPIETPDRVAADIVVDLEGSPLTSLFLDPFVLEGGALRWVGDADDDDREWSRSDRS